MVGGALGSWSSSYWSNMYAWQYRRAGMEQNIMRATNILFNASELAALRTKNVQSAILTITVSGDVPGANSGGTNFVYPIGYKLSAYDGADATGSSEHWTRASNNDATAAGTAAAGYLVEAGSSASYVEVTNKVYNINVGKLIPKYGYVIGPGHYNPDRLITYYVELGATATLTVVTDEVDSYTLTYNANGGSGAPGAQTFTPGSSVTLSGTKPTRTGYNFLGWSTSSSATSASYNVGGTYTFSGDTALYAVWQRMTYTVGYNANGGSNAPAAQTKTYGVDLTLSSAQPTRDGYSFLGWAKSSTASAADYAPGATFAENGNTTLYAVWQVITATHTLSYNANGGTGAPSSETKTYSITAPTSFTVSSAQPSRTGHQFEGWSSTAGGSVEYTAGDTIPASADKTLYAVWQINTYNVSFDANGGINPPSAQTKTYGVDLTLPTAQPTRDGYIFQGWAESADATEIDYPEGGTYTENQARTLYAVWQIRTYTVHFDAAGGSAAPADQTKVHGETLVLSPYIPRLKGYRFRGWGLAPNARTIAYAPGDDYTANANVTLYALWRRSMYAGVYVVRNGRAIPSGVYV